MESPLSTNDLMAILAERLHYDGASITLDELAYEAYRRQPEYGITAHAQKVWDHRQGLWHRYFRSAATRGWTILHVANDGSLARPGKGVYALIRVRPDDPRYIEQNTVGGQRGDSRKAAMAGNA